jgi:hypothetical protein
MADAVVGNATVGPDVASSTSGGTTLRVLDRHVRTLVGIALVQHGAQEADAAVSVGAWHDRFARLLHAVSLEFGTEAMATASEYAATALEHGLLYPSDELDAFIRTVASSVRTTSRDLLKGTPFGA